MTMVSCSKLLVLDEFHGSTQMPLGREKGNPNDSIDNGDGHSPRTVIHVGLGVEIVVLAYFPTSLVVRPLVVKVGDIYFVSGTAKGDSSRGFLEYIIDAVLLLLVLFCNPDRQLCDVCLV